MNKLALVPLVPLVLTFLAAPLVACKESGPEEPPKTAAPARRCERAPAETYAVLPFKNATTSKLELGGAHELLAASLESSGCFKLLERERLDVLLTEMKLCEDTNPDKAFMKCDSFAKKGNVLGVQRYVMPEVIFFEPKVKGAELSLKIPGVPGIEAGRSYTALSLAVRVVDVATSEQKANLVEHSFLSADQLGGGLAVQGLDLRAGITNKTPFGVELDSMLHKLTTRLAGGG